MWYAHRAVQRFNLVCCMSQNALSTLCYLFWMFKLSIYKDYVCTLCIRIIVWIMDWDFLLIFSLLILHLFACCMLVEFKYHTFNFRCIFGGEAQVSTSPQVHISSWNMQLERSVTSRLLWPTKPYYRQSVSIVNRYALL